MYVHFLGSWEKKLVEKVHNVAKRSKKRGSDSTVATVFSLKYRTAKNNSKWACPEIFRA